VEGSPVVHPPPGMQRGEVMKMIEMTLTAEREENVLKQHKAIQEAVDECEKRMTAKQQLQHQRLVTALEATDNRLVECEDRVAIVAKKVQDIEEFTARVDLGSIQASAEGVSRLDASMHEVEDWKYSLICKGLTPEFINETKMWLTEGKDSMDAVRNDLKAHDNQLREVYVKQTKFVDEIGSKVDKEVFNRENFKHDGFKESASEGLNGSPRTWTA
jgi:hypothetical protein